MNKKLWTVEELISNDDGPFYRKLSKAGLYKLMADGRIPCVKIGRKVFVPDWFVQKLFIEA